MCGVHWDSSWYGSEAFLSTLYDIETPWLRLVKMLLLRILMMNTWWCKQVQEWGHFILQSQARKVQHLQRLKQCWVYWHSSWDTPASGCGCAPWLAVWGVQVISVMSDTRPPYSRSHCREQSQWKGLEDTRKIKLVPRDRIVHDLYHSKNLTHGRGDLKTWSWKCSQGIIS